MHARPRPPVRRSLSFCCFQGRQSDVGAYATHSRLGACETGHKKLQYLAAIFAARGRLFPTALTKVPMHNAPKRTKQLSARDQFPPANPKLRRVAPLCPLSGCVKFAQQEEHLIGRSARFSPPAPPRKFEARQPNAAEQSRAEKAYSVGGDCSSVRCSRRMRKKGEKGRED